MNNIAFEGIAIVAFAGLAAAICLVTIPAIIRIARANHLYDSPDDIRKFHNGITPNLGGVAIFAAILFVFSVSGYAPGFEAYPWLVGGLLILFFTGIKDDVLLIDPSKKLFGQIAASMLVIWGGDLAVRDMGGVFGFHEIPEIAGVLLTLFTMIVVINAYNLIDGIDGLAGGIGIIASAAFGIWFYLAGATALSLLCAVMIGALAGFLWYNYAPASIFMGDTGSQVVGFLLGFLALSMVKIGSEPGVAVPFKNAVPIIPVAILIVPLYDTIRIFIIRSMKRKPFFKPDRQHIHHQLLGMGLSHQKISWITYLQNLFIIGLTFTIVDLNVNIILGTIVLTSMFIFPTFYLKRNLLKVFGFRIPSPQVLPFADLIVKRSSPPTNGNSSSGVHKPEQEREEAEREGIAL